MEHNCREAEVHLQRGNNVRTGQLIREGSLLLELESRIDYYELLLYKHGSLRVHTSDVPTLLRDWGQSRHSET